MKSIGKHRSASHGPRTGAAALMIGGLVAGTVATAGATTLHRAPATQDGTANALSGDLSARVTDDASATADLERAARASLRSASLSELRDQTAADRSEARTAPEDAATVETVLSRSGFTGQTIVQEPVEVVAESETVAETRTAAESGTAAPEPAQPEPAQQAAPEQQQTQQAVQPAHQQAAQPAPVQQAAPTPVGGSVLSVAAAYVGYPYVLYGTPPSSFDCSAYTWYVFQQAGISIPRTVAGQRGAVTPVSDPQPGDLVFYNDWHHVGIYAGGGMTYEALNASTDVRYGPLLSSNVWYGRIN
jgi:cell wall-associated NlpC family hydrolase